MKRQEGERSFKTWLAERIEKGFSPELEELARAVVEAQPRPKSWAKHSKDDAYRER